MPAAARQKPSDTEGKLVCAGNERGPVVAERQVVAEVAEQPVLGEELRQRLAAARRFGDDQLAPGRLDQEGLEGRQRALGTPVHGDAGQGLGPAAAARRHREAPQAGCPSEELVGGEEQLFGAQQRPLDIVSEELVALQRLLGVALQCRRHVAMREDRGAGGQVVEQAGGGVEEQRQPVLDAGRGYAIADIPVKGRFRRVAFEALAPSAAERGAGRLVHRELAAGKQPNVVDRIEAALRVGVEGADRIEFVAEQVEPEGQARAHREEVDQAATHAVLAGAHHLRHVLVAGEHQLRAQLVFGELLTLAEEEGVRGEEGRRSKPLERGGGGHHDHVARALLQRVQGVEALRAEILVRRQAVVGQRLPVGQQPHAQGGFEPGDLGGQSLRIGGRSGEDGQGAGLIGPLAAAGKTRGDAADQQRVAAARAGVEDVVGAGTRLDRDRRQDVGESRFDRRRRGDGVQCAWGLGCGAAKLEF
jgi:hypothetical protein